MKPHQVYLSVVVCPACGYPGRLYPGRERPFVLHSGAALHEPWYRYCWLTAAQAASAKPYVKEQPE